MIALQGAALLLPNLSTWLGPAGAAGLAPGRPDVRPLKPRILVIDDESSMCELLSLYLGEKGFEVATVRTTEGARTLVERGQFDAVVLDWNLNGVEGLDLLHLSKARHPEIPVIIFTGADLNQGSLGHGLAREADAIVRKMGPLDALATAILQQLERRRAQARDAA